MMTEEEDLEITEREYYQYLLGKEEEMQSFYEKVNWYTTLGLIETLIILEPELKEEYE